MKEITFKVLKDGERVVGFSLVPGFETLSEQFCSELHRGLAKGFSTIGISKEGEIVFGVPGDGMVDEFRTKLPTDDLVALTKLFAGKQANVQDLAIADEPLDLGGHGFRITMPGYEKKIFF